MKNIVQEWAKSILKDVIIVAVIAIIAIAVQLGVKQAVGDTPPQRVYTRLIDDGKYLIIYKATVDGEVVYSPEIVE